MAAAPSPLLLSANGPKLLAADPYTVSTWEGTCRQSRTGRRQGETPDTETQHHTCNAHLQRSPRLLYLDISPDGAAGSVEGGEPTVSASAITAPLGTFHTFHTSSGLSRNSRAPSHVVVLHGDYCCTVHVYTTDCLSRLLREAMMDLLSLQFPTGHVLLSRCASSRATATIVVQCLVGLGLLCCPARLDTYQPTSRTVSGQVKHTHIHRAENALTSHVAICTYAGPHHMGRLRSV